MGSLLLSTSSAGSTALLHEGLLFESPHRGMISHLCRLLSAIPLLIRELHSLSDVGNLSIAFPDEGAWKRFHTFFPSKWPTITCIKTRNGDKRKVAIREGETDGGDSISP